MHENLGVQEDLLLRIMDIVSASGTGFAFPSSTMYLARDSGNDTALTKAAEARVRALREKGELPFPDYAQARLAEMDDSIEYPPKGSALAAHRCECARAFRAFLSECAARSQAAGRDAFDLNAGR